jgi:hypothetical protein
LNIKTDWEWPGAGISIPNTSAVKNNLRYIDNAQKLNNENPDDNIGVAR